MLGKLGLDFERCALPLAVRLGAERAEKRRKIVPQPAGRLTAAAIEAWRKGDYWGLHGALGLKIWSMPDWVATRLWIRR